MLQPHKWLIGLVLLCCVSIAAAQTNPLTNKVDIQVVNTPLQQTLSLLAEEGKFSFAYSSDVINGDSLISYSAKNITVEEVLVDLFGNDMNYSFVGDHIILKRRTNNKKQNLAMKGQILDANTGRALSNVSIYSNIKFKSDLSGVGGAYQLDLNDRKPQQMITISKVGYQDTTFRVQLSKPVEINLKLVPISVELDTTDRVERLRLVNFFTSARQRINAFNINDTLTSIWQVSFLPFLGSNYKMSGVITNMFSLNILGGYSGGLKGLEIGGFFNIVRKEVIGLQMAGFGNTAGGDVFGVQLGGFYNLNLKNMRGWQAGGFVNMQKGSFIGAQTSGGLNYAAKLKGAQVGMINVVKTHTKGAQIGLVNYTKGIKGLQFGLLNIADSIKGTPIGFLSIVRKGYWHFDVYSDDLTFVNVSFRTGVRHFHNIITIGYGGFNNNEFWRIGYGIGSEFRFGKKKKGFTNVDLTGSFLSNRNSLIDRVSLLATLNWDIGIRFHKHFAMFIGPNVKWYHAITDNIFTTATEAPEAIGWGSVYTNTNDLTLNEVWFGLRGGFRF